MTSPVTSSVRISSGRPARWYVGWNSSCRLSAGGCPVRTANDGWSQPIQRRRGHEVATAGAIGRRRSRPAGVLPELHRRQQPQHGDRRAATAPHFDRQAPSRISSIAISRATYERTGSPSSPLARNSTWLPSARRTFSICGVLRVEGTPPQRRPRPCCRATTSTARPPAREDRCRSDGKRACGRAHPTGARSRTTLGSESSQAPALSCAITASATWLVPTAVGSSRFSFRSYVTFLPSAITSAIAPLQRVGGSRLLEVPQHQHARQHHGHRVDLVLARVLRRAAVRRLEHRAVGADVGARRQPQAADHARAEVRDDVAVQVRAAEDVVLARAAARAACTCCRRCGPRTRCPGSARRPGARPRGTARRCAS